MIGKPTRPFNSASWRLLARYFSRIIGVFELPSVRAGNFGCRKIPVRCPSDAGEGCGCTPRRSRAGASQIPNGRYLGVYEAGQ